MLNDIEMLFMKQFASIPATTDYNPLLQNLEDLHDRQEEINALKKEWSAKMSRLWVCHLKTRRNGGISCGVTLHFTDVGTLGQNMFWGVL